MSEWACVKGYHSNRSFICSNGEGQESTINSLDAISQLLSHPLSLSLSLLTPKMHFALIRTNHQNRLQDYKPNLKIIK